MGRDWGDVRCFENQLGRDSDGRTNSILCELLAEVRLHAEVPSRGEVANGGLFFTNAVLCLKKGDAQDEPPPQYFANCRSFLRRQIEIIQPKLVICLGQIAYAAVLEAFDRMPCEGPHRNAVEGRPVRLWDDGPQAVAVYDCSARSLNMNRKLPEQRQDWRRVGASLQSVS